MSKEELAETPLIPLSYKSFKAPKEEKLKAKPIEPSLMPYKYKKAKEPRATEYIRKEPRAKELYEPFKEAKQIPYKAPTPYKISKYKAPEKYKPSKTPYYPAPKIPRVPPPPYIRKRGSITRRPEKRRKKKQQPAGFVPYQKRYGKWSAIGLKPFKKERAIKISKKKALSTLGASVRVWDISRGKWVKQTATSRFRYGKKGKDPFTLVQRKYKTPTMTGRISSWGEKAEIKATAKRRKKARKKKK